MEKLLYNGFKLPLEINDYNRDYFEQVKAEAEALYDEKICSLTYSTFKLYEETGSREEYEKEYMLHRKMLCAFTAMVLADQGEKWMDKLCDIIWAVCDEFTWMFPAHIASRKTAERKIFGIDLFAGETSIALSEIYHILKDKLPPIVVSRIEYELQRRIINVYMQTRPKFGISNWSGVCGFGVLCAFVYLGKDKEFKEVKEHFLANMKDFLNSYPEDGCCLEGSLYWFYGFSHFTFAAELLRQYTKGEIDLFNDEKVKRMAHFCNNMYLEDNFTVSFSDSPHTYDFDIGIMSFLANKYDDVVVPPVKYAAKFSNDARYRFGPFIRNLYWAGKTPKDNRKDDYICYDKSEWYINRKYGYSFAAKAGHNNEPHNHNDVGSFLMFDGGEYIVDDIGWPRYTLEYGSDKRYENICASSKGHCLPIIDGQAQKEGADKKAVLKEYGENYFEFDYEKAYDVPRLEKLTRRFELTDKGVVVREKAKYDGKIVYRFVTRIKPEIKDDGVHIRNYVLSSKNEAEINISSFEFEPRFAGFGSEPPFYTAYAIDFAVESNDENEFYIFR